ncbi:MAG: multidrug effflux MFS transporter [Rickettsiales bacterium]
MRTQRARPMGETEFIFLMALLMSSVALSVDGSIPAMSVIGAELGAAHPNRAQHIVNCFFAGMAVGQLIAGAASDALGRRLVLFCGIGVYCCGAAMCYVAGDMPTMLAGRALQGAGAAGPYIMVMSIVRDKYRGRAMARVMSYVAGVFIMTPAVAPALGQIVMQIGGWRDIFVAYIAYAALCGLWAACRLRESLPKEKRTQSGSSPTLRALRKAAKNPSLWIHTAALGCVFAALTGYINAAQQIYSEIYGVEEEFPLYFGAGSLATGLASLLNGRLVRRFGMRRISLTASAATTMISVAVFLWVAQFSFPFAAFVAYGATLMFCFGFLYGNLNAMALESADDAAGASAAILGAFATLCGAGMGAAIGQLYDGTILPIVAGFVVTGCATLTLIYVGKKYRGKPL